MIKQDWTFTVRITQSVQTGEKMKLLTERSMRNRVAGAINYGFATSLFGPFPHFTCKIVNAKRSKKR